MLKFLAWMFNHPLETTYLLALPWAFLIPFYIASISETPFVTYQLIGVYTLMVLASGFSMGSLTQKLALRRALAAHKEKEGDR